MTTPRSYEGNGAFQIGNGEGVGNWTTNSILVFGGFYRCFRGFFRQAGLRAVAPGTYTNVSGFKVYD